MGINWVQFTPGSSLLGGLLIGASAGLFLLALGRIAGIAGLIARPILATIQGKFGASERVSLAFVTGLVLASWIWRLFAALPSVAIPEKTGATLIAGLLVGVGVRMGNGCTSGHGICGLSRLSMRSFVNVCAFMVAGMVTVYWLKHL